MKDVSGQTLQVGDKIAFCLGGRGTQMRVGVVDRMTTKSVIIVTKEGRHAFNEETRRWDKLVVVDVEVIRAFDAVSKIINQKGEEA